MIIDSHSHWLPIEIITHAHFFHKGWNNIEEQVKMMQRQGIDKAVISYPSSDAHLKLGGLKEVARIYNDNVGQIIKRYPDKFIGAAILPISNTEEMLEELKRALDLGLAAVSLASSYNGMYLDDDSFLPLFTVARERSLPIFVHSQIVKPIGTERVEDPLLTPVIEYVFDTTMCIGKMLMSDVLREFNEVKFIFAHFGGAIPFLAHRFDATYEMLRGMDFVRDLEGKPTEFLKNIYVDSGGDKIKTNFMLSIEFFGAKHVLWGSDWPAKQDISGAIAAVNDLGISQEDKDAILGGNAASIL